MKPLMMFRARGMGALFRKTANLTKTLSHTAGAFIATGAAPLPPPVGEKRKILTFGGVSNATNDTGETYVNNDNIVITGSFFAPPSGTSQTVFCTTYEDSNSSYQVLRVQITGVLNMTSYNGTVGVGTTPVDDGEIHTFREEINVSTGLQRLYLDGVFEYELTNASPFRWRQDFRMSVGAEIRQAGDAVGNVLDGGVLDLKIEHVGKLDSLNNQEYIFDSGSTVSEPAESGGASMMYDGDAVNDWSDYTKNGACWEDDNNIKPDLCEA